MGALIVFAVAIVLGVLIVKAIQRTNTEIASKEAAAVAEEQERQRKVAQAEKFAHYRNSDVLRKILKEMCIDATHLPEEIIIRDESIQATTNGQTQTYGFAMHGIRILESVCVGIEKREEIVPPQVAVAAAINYLLGDNYELKDYAIQTTKHGIYGGIFTDYRSNYVLLRRKPTYTI